MLLISCTRSFFIDVSDPFAAVFGNESFGGGFADFSALAKVSSRFLIICHVVSCIVYTSYIINNYPVLCYFWFIFATIKSPVYAWKGIYMHKNASVSA